jgi:glycosyltransferase involved in cell wall biosynthesis
MMHLVRQLPAWVLNYLPVQRARQFACQISPTTLSTNNQVPLQLLVDVSVIHQRDARTGIQRVVRALLLQLMRAPPIGYRICPVFATRHHGYRYAESNFLDTPAQDSSNAARAVQVQNGDLFLGLDLSAHLLPRHQAQILRWKRNGVKLHVLVYDLLPLQHPEWFNPKTTRNFERWIRWLAVYADSAICISEAVRTELHNWLSTHFDLLPSSISASTIVLGADIDASAPSGGLPNNADTLLAHLRERNSVLMVGTLEPRKGHDQALAAFEHLWQKVEAAPSLVLVGRAGWKTDVMQEKLRNHAESGNRLFWLDNVSDEYLICLYSACRGVLIASRAEGFGLPLVEAALHGKPVLARDLPVFREMKATHLTYFDSETPLGLANALVHWLHEIESPVSVVGFKELTQNFPTWQLSATQLLQVLGLQIASESQLHSTVSADSSLDANFSTQSPFKSVA